MFLKIRINGDGSNGAQYAVDTTITDKNEIMAILHCLRTDSKYHINKRCCFWLFEPTPYSVEYTLIIAYEYIGKDETGKDIYSPYESYNFDNSNSDLFDTRCKKMLSSL